MSELPERDLPTGRSRLLKEHLLDEIRRNTAPAKARRRWTRPVIASAAAAAAVAGLLVGASYVTDNDPPPPSKRTAERSSLPDIHANIRDDQFVYIESKVAYTGQVNGGPEKLDPLHRREIWKSVDGTRPGLLKEGTDSKLSPDGDVLHNERSDTYRALSKLPTVPVDMLDWLYRASGKQVDDEHPDKHEEAWVLTGDLVRESLMPPGVSLALLRAAAKIPGVHMVKDAVDAVGRHGVAIEWVDGADHEQLIFDRKTGEFIGERVFTVREEADGTKRDKVRGITAILKRAVVDRVGQRP